MKERLHPCPECGNYTEDDPCPVCADPLRDRKVMCVVETAEDLMCLEQASVFNGLYHVLGGRVSPLDGEDLDNRVLDALQDRILELGIREVIIATNPCVEGDLTYFAVLDALKSCGIRCQDWHTASCRRQYRICGPGDTACCPRARQKVAGTEPQEIQ